MSGCHADLRALIHYIMHLKQAVLTSLAAEVRMCIIVVW